MPVVFKIWLRHLLQDDSSRKVSILCHMTSRLAVRFRRVFGRNRLLQMPLQTPNPNQPQPPLAPEIHKPVQVRRPPSPDSVSATMLLNSLIVSKTRWCYHHVFSNLPSLWSRNVLWSQIALFWTIGIPAPISTCLENILSFLMEFDGHWTIFEHWT